METKTAMKQILRAMRCFSYLINDADRVEIKSIITNIYNVNNDKGIRELVKKLNSISNTTGSRFEIRTLGYSNICDIVETRF